MNEKTDETKTLEIVGTASMQQRDKIINSLEWEVRGKFGSQTYLLRGKLDEDEKTITYLYFGEIALIKQRYRVAFTAKPDSIDMILMSPTNNLDALKKSFVVMVKMGCIAGAIAKMPRPKDQAGPQLSVKMNG